MLADPRRRAAVLVGLVLVVVVLAQVWWSPGEDFGLWFGVVLGAPALAFGVQVALATRALTRPGAQDRDLLRGLTPVPFALGLAVIAAAIAPAAFSAPDDLPGVVTWLLWVVLVALSQFLGGALIGASLLLPAGLAVREILRRARGPQPRAERLPIFLLLIPPCLWVGITLAALGMQALEVPTRFAIGPMLAELVGAGDPADPGLMWAARAVLLTPVLVWAIEKGSGSLRAESAR